jgi:hypothetical protein
VTERNLQQSEDEAGIPSNYVLPAVTVVCGESNHRFPAALPALAAKTRFQLAVEVDCFVYNVAFTQEIIITLQQGVANASPLEGCKAIARSHHKLEFQFSTRCSHFSSALCTPRPGCQFPVVSSCWICSARRADVYNPTIINENTQRRQR